MQYIEVNSYTQETNSSTNKWFFYNGCNKTFLKQETVREPKHSEALLIPLPPISRLPFLHQKDEALARAGWMYCLYFSSLFWRKDFLTFFCRVPSSPVTLERWTAQAKGKRSWQALEKIGDIENLSFVVTTGCSFSCGPCHCHNHYHGQGQFWPLNSS